jgi:protein-tyrosine phosphatase
MIDLHIHVLPGIDDGASGWAESIEMCRMAVADGCDTLVVTPHQRKAWPNEDPEKLEKLTTELQERAGTAPSIHVGAEIHVDSSILDDLESPSLGGLCPLAGTRHLLIEFGHMPPPPGAAEIVHELVIAGWHPIVAHPEFIPFLAEDLVLLGDLVATGGRAQVTAMSVTGEFGRPVQNIVFEMIDEGLVHFVASDAHSPTWRPPGLSRAREALEHHWGTDLATSLTSRNPEAAVEGRPVASDPLATPGGSGVESLPSRSRLSR